MSNTGNPFTSNSNYKNNTNHVMISRGGEKKVMKKILSVALSTAMAFSMFASVAFGQAGLTDVNAQYDYLKEKGIFTGYPDLQAHLDRQMTRAEFAKVITKTLGLKEINGVSSFKDKNYTPKHWAAPYVEAVSAAGIMEGKNTTKKLFDLNGPVTVQEMATVLVRALDLEVPTETNNSATAWAKGYVQAAINAGLVDAKANFQSNASRALLVGAAYAVDQELSLQVKSYTVSEGGKVVEFKMSDDETVKVTLDKALEANKETEVKFTYKDKEFTQKVTYVVTTATKVDKASADNLREVKVAFDGEVDAATATDESNYTIDTDNGAKVTVKSASLSADKKVVTLTVESATNKGFTNQKGYTLDVSNVRAGDKVITASDVAFTPVDAALPVVQSAEALGNKAIKLTFSEPVVSTVSSNNFKIDGASVIGTTNVSGNTVILKLYTALSNAEHTVNVSGVADFSGLLNNSTDLKFSVVEDNAAPTVANVVNATFESVTVQFSEPVDPATLSAGNVFWKQGNTERSADSFEAISDTTYKFNFSGENKLIYATSLFVTGVQDYSGNTIAANTSVTVNPVVDQTRPEVVSAKLSDNSTSEIVVKYTKAVTTATATDEDNYVIKNSKGEVVSEFKNVTLSDNNKTATITLYEALTEGSKYTLTVQNVADTTTLSNVILPYTTDISVGNVTAPTVSSATYASNNRVIVTFDKAMDPATVSNTANYMYNNGSQWKAIPSSTGVAMSTDAKSVIFTFPSSVDVTSAVKSIRVANVKSAGGVTLSGLTTDVNVEQAQALELSSAKATATNTIKVDFNQNIQSASASDFEVTAGNTKLSVTGTSIDGDEVILTLANGSKLDTNAKLGNASVNVKVLTNKNLVTPTGAKFTPADGAVTDVTVADSIAPAISEVKREVKVAADGSVSLSVYFSEDIKASTLSQGKIDFDVVVDGTDLTVNDFEIAAGSAANEVVIKTDAGTVEVGDVIKVRITKGKYLTDAADNVVAGSTSYFSSLATK